MRPIHWIAGTVILLALVGGMIALALDKDDDDEREERASGSPAAAAAQPEHAAARGAAHAAVGHALAFHFDGDPVGKLPSGFTSYASGGGPAGKWVVEEGADAPSGKRVVVQTDADPTGYRFPILIADAGEFGDVDVSVKGRAISGRGDQGIGLVFRFRDPRSYYVVRANPLEDNFRLYKMVNGRRIQFAGANVKVTSGYWHTLRVVAKGDHIACYFDGRKLIEARDDTYHAGKVGLWTKADSVIAFDDLESKAP